MQSQNSLMWMVILSALISSVLTMPSTNPIPDDNGEWDSDGDWGEIQEPYPDWSAIDESYTGPEDDLGLGRFQYADILLMSWVPNPLDKWDYTLVNASTDNRYVKESGREHISHFTQENFPDVKIVFTCTEADVNYYFNEKLNVPVIGVEAFSTDYPFQQYLDHVFSIHAFWSRPDMWAHFFSHPRAFHPIINRVSRQYRTYLKGWSPRPEYNYNPDLQNGYGDDTAEPDADEGYSNESDNEVE